MDLLKNPFHILTVSSRDNRRRIMELADERSLLFDSSECMKARSDLTSPRKRLSAEVAWLPGIGPTRAGEILSLLESSPTDLLAIDKLSSIARANLLAAGLVRLPVHNVDYVTAWILEIAWTFENIDPEELVVIINEERVVSGFPEVSDLSAVIDEIQERRKHYCKVIKSALNSLSPKKLVEAVTVVVESATDNGEEHCPILIDDLVDSYEVEALGFLDKEEGSIKDLVEKLRAIVDAEAEVSDSVLAPMVNQLIRVVKNWETVAQPIQVSAKSRGFDHLASYRIAWLVRNLAIHMFNKHGKLEFSQQLTSMLQEVFADVGEVAERTAEDAEALGDIEVQRARLIEDAKNRDEEWRREITYEGYIGVVFKEKLSISPDGIEWKGKVWDLDSITRVRWGTTTISTRSRYSSLPTLSKLINKVQFGNDSGLATVTIETSFGLAATAVKSIIGNAENPIVFDQFTDCLWKAVCVRIFRSYVNGFSNGMKYRFGKTFVSDSGVELVKKGFFTGGDRIFCRWAEIETINANGQYCIRKKNNQKFESTFSYIDDDNIHILAAMVRMLKEKDNERLSDILG